MCSSKTGNDLFGGIDPETETWLRKQSGKKRETMSQMMIYGCDLPWEKALKESTWTKHKEHNGDVLYPAILDYWRVLGHQPFRMAQISHVGKYQVA